jgi:lipopolysaccharide exporter
VLGHGLFGLGAAWLGYGAFSLGISALAQGLIQMLILYGASRHTVRLTFRPAAYRAIYAFSTRVTVINFLEFLSFSLDTFFLGRLYPLAALGLYNRAYSVVCAPAMNVATSLTRVLAPSFSAVQTELPRLQRAYLSALSALLVVMGCLAGSLLVDAHEIVLVMLGRGFSAAVPLVQVFGLMIPFLVSSNLSGILAEATARLTPKIVIQAVYLLGLGSAFWLTYRLGGSLLSVAWVLAAATMLRSLALVGLARSILGGGRVIAARSLAGLVSAVVSAAITYGVVTPLRTLGIPLALLFAVELLLGLLLVTSLLLLGPANEAQTLLRRLLTRATSRLRAAGSP